MKKGIAAVLIPIAVIDAVTVSTWKVKGLLAYISQAIVHHGEKPRQEGTWRQKMKEAIEKHCSLACN